MGPRAIGALASALVAVAFAPALAAAAAPVAGASAAHTYRPRRTPASLRYARGQLVVIADDATLGTRANGAPHSRNARLADALASLGLSRAHPADPTPQGANARKQRIWVLESSRPDFDPVSAARTLEETGAVRAACPNYFLSVFSTTPNDLYLIFQWYVDDGGFADVRLPQAWDVERGDTSVVIAIVDTGVDASHPDLASRIWHNPGEIPGNGIDDDGNGFVDDTEGWDFGTNDNDPKPEYLADPSGVDVGFHGTFCAGIAAAATNNDEGIAGADWYARIMPLKAASPDSGLYSSAVAGAIAYAADQHASILSMSFGAPGDPGVPEFFQALVDMATASGMLCVAAAGNDGDSTRTYPAACDHVFAVGATDPNNARASFSNWGPWVDIAAPGSTMWSTISQNYTFTDLDQLIYYLGYGWDGVNPYMYGDGTSFACPLVAGVCALVRAKYPYLTPDLVMQQVIATGDAVAFDEPVGPKLNALQAVSVTPTGVAAEGHGTAPAFAAAVSPNPSSASTKIRFTLPAGGRTRLVVYDVAGRRVRELLDESLAAGPHVVSWDGRDDRGVRVGASIYLARLECAGRALHAKIVRIGR
jgi:subtilisin family serine protease